MRIVTFVSQILDASESVRIHGGVVDISANSLVVDTMDEYGVEEALRIIETGLDGEIIALAIGPATVEEALRSVLSVGVDRAIHVVTEEAVDALTAGAILAQVAKEEGADLVFVGGQQASLDSQAIGPVAAERLGWPQLTWVRSLNLEDRIVTGSHDTDEGSRSFQVSLPVVITTQQGLNDPRYPTLPNIFKAAKKEIRQDDISRFGHKPSVRTVSASLQTRKRLNLMIDTKDPGEAAVQIAEVLKKEGGLVA
jgi:electron transfer flavoprotein beta subunit